MWPAVSDPGPGKTGRRSFSGHFSVLSSGRRWLGSLTHIPGPFSPATQKAPLLGSGRLISSSGRRRWLPYILPETCTDALLMAARTCPLLSSLAPAQANVPETYCFPVLVVSQNRGNPNMGLKHYNHYYTDPQKVPLILGNTLFTMLLSQSCN